MWQSASHSLLWQSVQREHLWHHLRSSLKYTVFLQLIQLAYFCRFPPTADHRASMSLLPQSVQDILEWPSFLRELWWTLDFSNVSDMDVRQSVKLVARNRQFRLCFPYHFSNLALDSPKACLLEKSGFIFFVEKHASRK